MPQVLSTLQERTVHLIAHHGQARKSLTGFIVADGLILTCAHDIVDASRIEVRRSIGEDRLRDADIVWQPDPASELDAAVLAVPGLGVPIHRAVAWGEIRGFTGMVEAVGFGYPAANRAGDEDDTGGGFHVSRLSGAIVPGEGLERARLVFQFGPGQVTDDAMWGGASGMAVFDLDQHRLLGVVSGRLTDWHNRWDLTPATAIQAASDLPEPLRRLPRRSLDRPESLIEPSYFAKPELSSDFKLLSARYGYVPYISRSHKVPLERLAEWCAGVENRVSISVLTGQAGAGKTRLAAELCATVIQRYADWTAGFARTGSADRWARFIPERPTLAVFDYTDRRDTRASLAAWLRHLSTEADECPNVRILLLDRHAGAWLDDLDNPTEGVAGELRRTGLHLDLRETVHGSSDGVDVEIRKEHARAAYRQFRDVSAVEPVPQELFDLVADDRINSPLLVHIAALLAAREQPLPNHNDDSKNGSSLRDQLLQRLLSRERLKHWNDYEALSLTEAPPADCDEAAHALGIVNLTQPDRDEVDNLLTASTLWAAAAPAKRRAAANAIYALYPGPPRPISDLQSVPTVAAMEPDLISEYLLSTITPADLASIVERLHSLDLQGRHIDRMLHLAGLTADHYMHISGIFDHTVNHFLKQAAGNPDGTTDSAPQILATRLEHLVKTALTRAGEKGKQSVTNLLTTALQRYGDHPEVAEAAANIGFEVPYPAPNRQTTELAIRLETLATQHFEGTHAGAELAHHLNQLGRRLLAIGRDSEALLYLDRAEQLYRSLTVHDDALQLAHANSIRDLGSGLSRLGRHQEALPHYMRAVDFNEALASDGEHQRSELARSLNNLGYGLGRLGRHHEALPTLELSLHLYEELAVENTDLRPDFVTCLSNYGAGLGAVGRHHEAPPYFERALELRVQLAANNPAHLPDLAMSHNNMGSALGELGNFQEALPHLQRAVEIRETLADDNPAQLADLAMNLNNLGRGLLDLGRYQEALDHIQRALTINEALASQNPASLEDLAKNLNNLGGGLVHLGHHREALPHFQRAAQIREAMAADNDAHLPDLAMSLNNLAGGLLELGRYQEALPVFGQALQLSETLAAENDAYLPDLAVTLNNIGALLKRIGKISSARHHFYRASKIYENLANDNPGAFDKKFKQCSADASSLDRQIMKRDKARANREKRRRRK